jgi:hypothetical protein
MVGMKALERKLGSTFCGKDGWNFTLIGHVWGRFIETPVRIVNLIR